MVVDLTVRDLNARKLAYQLPIYGLCVLLTVIYILPFAWMILSSFKSGAEIAQVYGFSWLPKRWMFDNYVKVWELLPLFRGLLNSAIVSVGTVMFVIVTSGLAGYALAKFSFRGDNLYFRFVIATMMLPWFIILIPTYIIVKNLGLMNSYLGVIVPGMVSAFGIFLMRQFILSIPDELLDSARIDGCSEMGIWWRIILPMTKPINLTLGLLIFMWTWNDFLWPMLVLHSREMATIQMLLKSLQWDYANANTYGTLLAGTAIATLPTLVFFLFTQHYFVRSMAISGMKGG